jgi:hypothetical protein
VSFVSDRPRAPRDEELEELSEDVILAQETAVHVPQPRANVETDQPTVVISEAVAAPNQRATIRARRTTEKTVVIRDRRNIERTRRAISERQQQQSPLPPKSRFVERRTLYLLALAAVGSLLVGTLIAAVVDWRRDDRLPLPAPTTSSGPPAASAEAKPIDTVDLHSLPVDRSRRHAGTATAAH